MAQQMAAETNQIDMEGDIPVGGIIAYMGNIKENNLKEDLKEQGWLLCDGSSYAQSDYEALFSAIGQKFGYSSDRDGDFCVPDLRGVFLRGVDGEAGRDLDAGLREGSGPNGSGNSGNAIGSLQGYATGLPNSDFKVQGKLNSSSKTGHGGGPDHGKRIKYRSDSENYSVSSGGDAESRPVNTNVYYLIKALPNDLLELTVGQVPIGGLISLPFDPEATTNSIPDVWKLCDGESFKPSGDTKFNLLYAVIGTNSGGTSSDNGDVTLFNIPDLSGMFLRGVKEERDGEKFDPDSSSRLSSRPDCSIEGNSGNNVGSYQGWATGPTVSKGLYFTLEHAPLDASPNWQAGGATAARYQDGQDFSLSGGDVETCPKNLGVGWHIRYKMTTSITKGEALPVGTIIAVGSDEAFDNWLVCDGQAISKSDYPDLFDFIGTRFGAADSTFNVPDLRGRFLRGVGKTGESTDEERDHGSPKSADILRDGGDLYQDDFTALPNEGFKIFIKGYPGSSRDDIASYPNGSKILRFSDTQTSRTVKGGDSETRPINVNVRFMIKVKG